MLRMKTVAMTVGQTVDHTKNRCGRVTLLLWSSGGMLLSCATITLSLLGLAPNYVALLGVMAFVSFFEIGELLLHIQTVSNMLIYSI
jgi:Sugar (and other) transporter